MLKLTHLHQSPSFQLQFLVSLKTVQNNSAASTIPDKHQSSISRLCSCCGRRHFIEAATVAFLPISFSTSNPSTLHTDDYLEFLNKIHLPKNRIDGTSLKFWQTVVDPLQQTVADGCHPVYGIACN